MNKIALIIGVQEYDNISSLSNTKNDAVDISNFLNESGFKVTTLINPSQRELIKSITFFKSEITENSVSLVYFAGHGIQLDGVNFLVPRDAQISIPEEIPYFCINASDCLPKEGISLNNVYILILDACRNNPFQSRFRSPETGLAKMTAPTGTLIAFSTGPNGVSIEIKSERNGVYTQKLLAHLKTPNLSLERIFKNTRTDVIKVTDGRQVPWEESSLHGEDFYFIKVPTALDYHLRKELIFAYKILTEDLIEFTREGHSEINNEKVTFEFAVKLFKKQYEELNDTINPKDAFFLLFNLQKIIHQTYKFISITRHIEFKEIDKLVLKHGKDLSDSDLLLYQKVILTAQHYGSIFLFNDKFGNFQSIKRQIENNTWVGFKLDGDILEHQNRIMEDLDFVKKNELHLNEFINCQLFIGIMNEFFLKSMPRRVR